MYSQSMSVALALYSRGSTLLTARYKYCLYISSQVQFLSVWGSIAETQGKEHRGCLIEKTHSALGEKNINESKGKLRSVKLHC